MRIVFYIGGIIFIMFFAACSIDVPDFETEAIVEELKFDSTGIELSQVYFDSINNFSIRYPEDWILMNSDERYAVMGAGPGLTETKTQMARDGGVGLSIASFDKQYTTPQYYFDNLKTIRRTYPDFKIIDEKTIDLNGIKAKYVSHIITLNEVPFTSIQIYFFVDQIGYVLNGSASSKEFNKYRDLYISIAKTFQLTGKL